VATVRSTEDHRERRAQAVVGVLGALAVVALAASMLATPVVDPDADRPGGPSEAAPVPAEGGIPLDAPIPEGMAVARQEAFAPAELEVEEGVVLVFRNEDDDAHTFTADDGLFDSGVLRPGEVYSFGFDGPAEVRFHCEVHPTMRGTITVTARD
jgi:hypothetical protein